MHVYATAKSDVGRVRERNEDAYLVNDALSLYAVADGMGGHAGGARASSLTVETLAKYVEARKAELGAAREPDENDAAPPLAKLLADAVRAACAAVYDAAAAEPALSGMGTTCTVLLVRPGWAYVAHVGDSRCYMQRGTRFLQVTEDHSLVNEQVRAGILRPEDAARSRLKNIITRSVGFEREVEVDTFLVPLQPGDHFLLCSDGLSNLVENAELGEAMMAMQDEPLVAFLIDVALERGGDDNVTAVCVRMDQDAAQQPEFTTEERELTTQERELSTEERELTTEEREVTTEERELTTEERQLSALERDLAAEDDDPTTEPGHTPEPVEDVKPAIRGPHAANGKPPPPPVASAPAGAHARPTPGIPPVPQERAERRPTGPNEDTDPQRAKPLASDERKLGPSSKVAELLDAAAGDVPTDPGTEPGADPGSAPRRRGKRR